ncbi:MAG TPA: 3-phosphoshikimate 1-carboxyvinyltransferase [Rhodobiaceae bacterium]|nr:3-phosphoshikimate 1-carboxyvinyltransferase [Rhodobiaceae bacterium]
MITSSTKLPSKSRRGQPLSGKVRVPGDKSISHRALILAGMAIGTSKISGLLEGADVLATMRVMQALGVHIEKHDSGDWHVTGVGPMGLSSPAEALDFGNAGTGVRLVMGLVAGAAIRAQFTGDTSLSARPMERILAPLRAMGAQAQTTNGCLPVKIEPAALTSATITPNIASAQVKSAILLAALGVAGTTTVREKTATRGHSESMMRLMGADIRVEETDGYREVSLHNAAGPTCLKAVDLEVPGDPSSAAFPLVAALTVPGSDLVLENIMLNRQRDGLIRVLRAMGGDIAILNERQASGETIGDLRVRHSDLTAVNVAADTAPDMIDEFPALAVAAAVAEGTSHMAGLAELRVKESDRLDAIEAGLKANGVAVEAGEDWLKVTGGAVPGGAEVQTHQDHRIAMAFLCLGLIANKPISIDDRAMIATSFPEFFELMADLGAQID